MRSAWMVGMLIPVWLLATAASANTEPDGASQRLDNMALARQVTDRLAVTWLEPSMALVVVVGDGVVDLYGEVESVELAEQAGQQAADVAGVERVVNWVRVVTPEERPARPGERAERLYLNR